MPTKREILDEVNQILTKKKLPEIEKIRVGSRIRINWPDLAIRVWIKGVANDFLGSFHRTARERNIDIFIQPSQQFFKTPLETSLQILCDYLNNNIGTELETWEKIPN